MQFGWLRFAHDQNTLAAIWLEILHHRCDPVFVFDICLRRSTQAEVSGDSLRQWQNIPGSDGDAMIGI